MTLAPPPAGGSRPGSGAPTIREVARQAQVSPMTVSRTLRDDPGVSAATRARVMDAVLALGYRPNEAARTLRLGRSSGLIGLVVTNLANPFYSQLTLGVEAVATEHGMRVLLGNSGSDPARERQLVHDFAARRVAGLIAVPCHNDHSHLDPGRLGGLPVVLAGSPPVKIGVDAVLLDDFTGSWEATRHLIARGHRRIAFLGLPASTWTGSERFRGYCAALEEAALPVEDRYVWRRQAGAAPAQQATRELLDDSDPPTAIFAANNRNTVGAYRAIRQRGAATALTGFDDFELADALAVPLTVVAYEPREMGAAAARLLRDRIGNAGAAQAPRRVVIPTTIVEYGAAAGEPA
jgi:LacI family transcriptional regulator